MATPSSYPLTSTDIRNEYGDIPASGSFTSADCLSLNGVDGSYPLTSGDMLGISDVIYASVGSKSNFDVVDYVVNTLGISSGNVELTLTGTYTSTSTGTPAVKVGSNLNSGINLTLILASTAHIYGKGGAGGNVSSGTHGSILTNVLTDSDGSAESIHQYRYFKKTGSAGGTGLYVRKAINIKQTSCEIYGGGGGGGATQLLLESSSDGLNAYRGGGGGGGGAGSGGGGGRYAVTTQWSQTTIASQSVAGSSGSNTGAGSGGASGKVYNATKFGNYYYGHGNTLTEAKNSGSGSCDGKGGNGGGSGAAGSSSTCYPNLGTNYASTSRAAGGGAAGKAIDGNSYITWTSYSSSYVKGSVVN